MRITLNGVLLVGLLGGVVYLLTRPRPAVLRPVQPDVMSGVGFTALDSIIANITTWTLTDWQFGDSWGNWQYSGDPAGDLQRRFEMGHYGSL